MPVPGPLPSSFAEPRRLLVRGVNWLGDAVMTTPALLRLRERFPQAHLALLTPDKLADLWRHHPAINEVISFSFGEGPLAVALRLHGHAATEQTIALDHQLQAAFAQPWDETGRQHRKLSLASWVFGALHVSWETAAAVSSKRFDLALVLPNSPRSALEVWLARVPQRVGYARPWRNGLLTRRVFDRPGVVTMRKGSARQIRRWAAGAALPPAERAAPVLRQEDHHSHHYLHLAAAVGADPTPVAPRLAVTDEEARAVALQLGLEDPAGDRFVLLGLNPGAEYGPAKRWPAERFVEVAARIQRRVSCRWLVFGGSADAALAEKITADICYEAARPPALASLPAGGAAMCLAGRTSLRELMALLKRCRLVLTNDTGPMHVAAALGTPVVVPFGSTSPELTGPGLPGEPGHRLLRSGAACAPCFLPECPIDFRCMADISVERVVSAALEVLLR